MIFVLVSVVLRAGAALCGKFAALRSAGGGIFALIVNPWFVLQLFLLFLQALAWTSVLRKISLSLAYPFMSLVIACNLFLSWLVFDERISVRNAAGAAVIVLGILLSFESERKNGKT